MARSGCVANPSNGPQRRWWLAALLGPVALLATQPVQAAVPGGGVDALASEGNPPHVANWDDRLPAVQPLAAIGAMSVGHAHAGYLVNGVQMPTSKEWLLSVPDQSWGTPETIRFLATAIHRVNERFPDSPPAIIGAISARGGGALKPHKSHRTGRDADVHFYLSKRGKAWYEPATADNLDRPRTWALLRAVITETDVQFVLIDRSVQALLEEYALRLGEDPAWIHDIFHGTGRYPNAMVKHIPGHTGHMHIRFFNPIAQERGRRAYPRLVKQGHIELPSHRVQHEVVRGDTLLGIAERFHTSTEAIQKNNDLDSELIKVGQKLTIEERIELRGALDPVVIPPRRRPAKSLPQTELASQALGRELDLKLRTLEGG